MSKIHIVEQGEHLSGIAAQNGFSSFRVIWDHPQNAELKQKRKNPNILFPGDRLFIPDKELREESRATDQLHRFEAAREELQLRVKVLDLTDKPVSGPCFLVAGGVPNPMAENDNVFEGFIQSDVKEARMEFPDSRPKLKVSLAPGRLDPINTPSGQRERLNNLGYFAGYTEGNAEQFEFAVEEFQCDHQKELGLKKPTGVCDAKTQALLEKVHGDKLGG